MPLSGAGPSTGVSMTNVMEGSVDKLVEPLERVTATHAGIAYEAHLLGDELDRQTDLIAVLGMALAESTLPCGRPGIIIDLAPGDGEPVTVVGQPR